MKLGVIGGMGPLATAYYYELLTKMSLVNKDQEHLEIIIYSCPQIPDRTTYILDHNNSNPLQYLIKIGKDLEKQKVNYLAIPCITAHYFHKELEQSLHIPIINLINEVGNYLTRKNIKCVGIMATTGTIETLLFQKELKKRNIRYVIPEQIFQQDVMHLIYENVKKGKKIEENIFFNISNELFKNDCQLIILGCTELSIIKKECNLDERYLDSLELLAAVTLKMGNINIQKNYQYLID